MKSNKDRNTLVGFSNSVKIAKSDEIYPITGHMETKCEHRWVNKVMGDIGTGEILRYKQCLKCGRHTPIETAAEMPELFEKDKEDEIWEDVLFRSMAFTYEEQKRCIAHLKAKFEIKRKP